MVRPAASETYPSRFMLVCAMNPCKCGWYGHPSGRCRCSPAQVKNYLGKLSGPCSTASTFFAEVPPLDFEDLVTAAPGSPPAAIKAWVTRPGPSKPGATAPTALPATPPWARRSPPILHPWTRRARP